MINRGDLLFADVLVEPVAPIVGVVPKLEGIVLLHVFADFLKFLRV